MYHVSIFFPNPITTRPLKNGKGNEKTNVVIKNCDCFHEYYWRKKQFKGFMKLLKMGFLTASPNVISPFSFYADSLLPPVELGRFNHPWNSQFPEPRLGRTALNFPSSRLQTINVDWYCMSTITFLTPKITGPTYKTIYLCSLSAGSQR